MRHGCEVCKSPAIQNAPVCDLLCMWQLCWSRQETRRRFLWRCVHGDVHLTAAQNRYVFVVLYLVFVVELNCRYTETNVSGWRCLINGMVTHSNSLQSTGRSVRLIPVAARSKVWVCGQLYVGTARLNSAGDVVGCRVFCERCVTSRGPCFGPIPLSRGVLHSICDWLSVIKFNSNVYTIVSR